MTPPRPPTPPPPPTPPHDNDSAAPPRDELDSMLRQWHAANADRARAGRDRLMAALAAEAGGNAQAATQSTAARDAGRRARSPVIHVIRRTIMNRYSPMAAAALIALAVLVSMLIPATTQPTMAAQGNVVMAPVGGRLDAVDGDGNILGPCELKRTDVDVQISGFLTRVTLRQQYRNPHADKIEAVYTFPMSHRAAVDRMTMTIGERVIVGEVKEREAARQIYQSARDQGRIAGLLEQERPNIFTQSVANIEPGAEIDIEISYVEVLEQSEGRYTFSFPTVVAPRYIPGTPAGSAPAPLPEGVTPRRGLVLLAPASITITSGPENAALPALAPAQLAAALERAQACETPRQYEGRLLAPPWHRFVAAYPDGSAEQGFVDPAGFGHVGGRWFWIDAEAAAKWAPQGNGGFSPDTNLVPDASRITPMPVRPEVRAGHDIGITVTIDTGGPAIAGLEAPLHEVVTTAEHDVASMATVALKDQDEIPNRDFVLSWSLAGDEVQESIFTHNGAHGGFFSLILQPPARVDSGLAVPRELVFVLDTSGSMRGYPMEKSKEVMARAIESMRDRDTFNIITFSGDTQILWDRPRPNTAENRAEAQRFLASQRGRGGTEMMAAIEAALRQEAAADRPARPEAITLAQLADLPADGREVTVELPWDVAVGDEEDGGVRTVPVRAGLSIRVGPIPPSENTTQCPVGETMLVTGAWVTENGERLFRPRSARWKHGLENLAPRPLRLAIFLTDGLVGNDMAIIDAIRRNRGTTRVFSLGIGNSVNRFLLDNMARAGGGEVEYVLLESDAAAAVERLTRRISTPVLSDISVEFSEGLKVVDVLPGVGENAYPDLFDAKPLVIHGRFTAPGSGTVTIRGVTGAGAHERVINLDLPRSEARNDVIATLWAREKIEQVMSRDLAAAQRGALGADQQREVVTLGETFGIMSQYTSFVAVDKLRVTIGGQPRLVNIPIEMASGVSWEGVFGAGGEQGFEDADGDGMVDSRWFEGRKGPADDVGERMLALGRSRERSLERVAGHWHWNQDSSGQVERRRRAHLDAPARVYTRHSSLGPGEDSLEPVPMVHGGQLVVGSGAAQSPPAAAGLQVTPVQGRLRASVESHSQLTESEEIHREELEFTGQKGYIQYDYTAGTGAAAPSAAASSLDLLRSSVQASPFYRTVAATLGELGGRGVPPELVIIRVAELAEASKIEEGRALADALVASAPGYEPAARVRAALDAEAAERAAVLGAERERCRGMIEGAVREMMLRARMAPSLQTFARMVDLPQGLDPLYAGTRPEGAMWKDGGVLVSILVGSADGAMVKRVRGLGAKVEAAAPAAGVIVAVVPLGKLGEAAMLEGVRRVEPARLSVP